MILDGHIHLMKGTGKKEDFAYYLKKAGIDGGIVLSPPPASFYGSNEVPTEERIKTVLSWTESHPNLFAFFWIDPLEKNALDQVNMAKGMGIDGIKAICNRFFPGDERPMKIWKAAARENLPILFHSGISYAGINSSKYHRPAEFESLFTINGIRFTLAHISWPWIDECLAVYGKFDNRIRPRKNLNIEMFIDITPGTPPIYREEAFKKMFHIGYNIKDNIIFGTDCRGDNYDINHTQEWIERDNKIYNQLGLTKVEIEKIYHDNLIRFIGKNNKSE